MFGRILPCPRLYCVGCFSVFDKCVWTVCPPNSCGDCCDAYLTCAGATSSFWSLEIACLARVSCCVVTLQYVTFFVCCGMVGRRVTKSTKVHEVRQINLEPLAEPLTFPPAGTSMSCRPPRNGYIILLHTHITNLSFTHPILFHSLQAF